jgi:hypothetical protein
VTGAGYFPASPCDFVEPVAKLRDEAAHHFAVVGEIGRRSIKTRLDLHGPGNRGEADQTAGTAFATTSRPLERRLSMLIAPAPKAAI